jgi:hypothetical protein
MWGMFIGCNSLNYIDISNFNEIRSAFSGYYRYGNCTIVVNNRLENESLGISCKIIIKEK